MKNTLLAFLIVCVSAQYGQAQNEPLQGMFWNNFSYFNPALSGYKYNYQGFINYRDQWSADADAPKDFFGNYSMFLEKSRVALGTVFQRETVGALKEAKFMINSAYRFALEKSRSFSLGAGIGLSSQVFNTDELNFPDSAEITGKIKETLFTGDIGLAYEAPKFMIGVSVKNLNNPKGRDTLFTLEENRNLFIFSENKINIGENFVLTPRASIRSDFNIWDFEINGQLTFKEKYSLGFGYRDDLFSEFDHPGTLIANLNWDILGKIRIGYAIEFIDGLLKDFGPSHEAVIGIKLKERAGSAVKKKLKDQ